MGEGLTNADIEDVVKNILPKPQPCRPKSFSTAERSTKGETSPCVERERIYISSQDSIHMFNHSLILIFVSDLRSNMVNTDLLPAAP